MKIFRYFLPGIVFQSIFIGGGYATGREIVEYVVKYGVKGLYVIPLVGILFAIFMFLSFDIARRYGSYDYRTFSKQLLGKFWILFDFLYISMSVIAIAVVVSASSSVLSEELKLNYFTASFNVLLFVFILFVLGTKWIIRYKVVGTFLLYMAFIYFFILILSNKSINLANVSSEYSNWIKSGVTYAGYNFVVIPACLYTITNLKRRKEIVIASAIGSMIAIIPMIFLYIVLIGDTEIISEKLPLLFVLKHNAPKWSIYLYYLVLFWTLIETSVGLIHAIIDRLDSQLLEIKKIKLIKYYKALISVFIIIISLLLAQVGIITLVGKYYGTLAIGFLLLFCIPLIVKYYNILFKKI